MKHEMWKSMIQNAGIEIAGDFLYLLERPQDNWMAELAERGERLNTLALVATSEANRLELVHSWLNAAISALGMDESGSSSVFPAINLGAKEGGGKRRGGTSKMWCPTWHCSGGISGGISGGVSRHAAAAARVAVWMAGPERLPL